MYINIFMNTVSNSMSDNLCYKTVSISILFQFKNISKCFQEMYPSIFNISDI